MHSRRAGKELALSKRITIKDVAEDTGLSIAAVSYVLNDKDGVRPETRELVLSAVERLGYVRGMQGHIEAALIAIKAILTRGAELGTWRPVTLHYYELDAITSAVDLHDHQLRQLSAGELHTATKRVIAHMQSQGGGQLLHVAPADLGMEATA